MAAAQSQLLAHNPCRHRCPLHKSSQMSSCFSAQPENRLIMAMFRRGVSGSARKAIKASGPFLLP
eukprot:scaffold33396_cov17-Tisochrysis_lutea.AAC.1